MWAVDEEMISVRLRAGDEGMAPGGKKAIGGVWAVDEDIVLGDVRALGEEMALGWD